jgi:UDP-N-acetylmuramate--L-alanine ligase/UDP-N-acetylenolpyruvoylglucosamine reductase
MNPTSGSSKSVLLRRGGARALGRLVAGPPGKAHLVGVCGVGMAGLAYLLKARGWKVDGCDGDPGNLAAWLKAKGISVRRGHSAGHVRAGVSLVIRTAAVRSNSEEVAAALRAGIPVVSRGEVLPLLLEGRTGIAVGGTHGKTTTTSFVTRFLSAAGRDPSWCIGGENPDLGGVAGAGAGGELVVEADESDGTLALYRPEVAVVTNVDFDHMEHFSGVADLERCFLRFMSNARRCVVYCRDDRRAAALARRCGRRAVGYGLGPGARVRGVSVALRAGSSSFTVLAGGKALGRVDLPVPGVHNVRNALAAIAVGLELGLPFAAMREAARNFALPRRRFDRIVDTRELLVVSDYSHHPAEIAALVAAARAVPRRRLLAVFQPHRYTRTLALGEEFPASFAGVDRLVLAPVYAASEPPLGGGSTWDLYCHFRKRMIRRGRGTAGVCAASSLDQAWGGLRGELRAGDMLLVVGAGSVERIAAWAGEEFKGARGPARRGSAVFASEWNPSLLRLRGGTIVRSGVEIGRLTGYGVGGCADWYAEPAAEGDLARLLAWCESEGCPVNLFGGGRNILVPDTGLRGLALRLCAPAFRSLRVEGERIAAGAGVPLAALAKAAGDAGLAGLEFLAGIPGTVGGALRMNAGAYGGAIGDAVESIQCLNPDGSRSSVTRETMGAEYRRCRALEKRVAVAAVFGLRRGDPAAIRAEREAILAKRAWMNGLRCAGSVFMNPRGDHAGRLLEAAGQKGASVGGARVSTRHANVIVTGPGACASDVRALMERMRWAVEERFGVRLESEVVLLGEA